MLSKCNRIGLIRESLAEHHSVVLVLAQPAKKLIFHVGHPELDRVLTEHRHQGLLFEAHHGLVRPGERCRVT